MKIERKINIDLATTVKKIKLMLSKQAGFIDGEDLSNEIIRKRNRRSRYLIAPTFFSFVLLGNYLINLIDQIIASDFGFNFFDETQIAEVVWFSWAWLFNAKTGVFFLINLMTSVALTLITYKQLKNRLESLASGQKGDHRFKTLPEIKAQFVEIPDRQVAFCGIGGVLISHYKNSYFIDLDTVNSLFLGTTRSGKGEGHVIPFIDILSRATIKSTMIINDPKSELFCASKEILQTRGYEVQVLNILDPMQSMSYNPLHLIVEAWQIGDKPTAQRLVSTFAYAVFNDPHAGQNKWVYDGAQKLFSAVILAMIDECDQRNELEKVTPYNAGQMITELSSQKFVNPKTGIEKDGLDMYFEKLPKGHLAKARYASALSAGEKTKGNILMAVFDRLDIFQSETIAKMTSANSFDLKSVGFPGTINLKFDKSLFNHKFKVILSRAKKILTTASVKPNLTGFTSLHFEAIIKTGDKLEIIAPSLPRTKNIKRAVYRLEKIVDENAKPQLQSIYQKNVKLHQEIAELEHLHQIEITYSEQPIAVFMITPDYDQSQNVITSTFVKQLYTTLAQNASKTKGKKCFRRVQFILDEAGNMPTIEGLDQILTVCLGRNILFNLFLQSYSQLDTLYGKDNASVIKENCQNHIYIASGDPNTHEEISKKASNTTVESLSISEKVLEIQTSQTRQATEERIISTGRVSTLLEGETIVFCSLKRRDLLGNKIRPFPIFNTKVTAMPYRYQFLADDFDTNKDINDFDIPSMHTHLCLTTNAINFDSYLKIPTKQKKITEVDVREWLKEKTTVDVKIIDKILKNQKTP